MWHREPGSDTKTWAQSPFNRARRGAKLEIPPFSVFLAGACFSVGVLFFPRVNFLALSLSLSLSLSLYSLVAGYLTVIVYLMTTATVNCVRMVKISPLLLASRNLKKYLQCN